MTEAASLWAGARKFEQILQRDPQAYSFAPLADLYRKLGLLQESLDLARKGCAVHPGFAAGQMALAQAALESSLKDEAIRALEAVVRITPERLEAQRLLADLYTAAGNPSAAGRCLEVVDSLEYSPINQPATMVVDDDGAEAEIMELTDDLIEDEVLAEDTERQFSALPDRPSLGDSPPRAEPFMMETAPPIYQEDSPPSPLREEESPEPEQSAAVASATIAELYVSQGFPEKGAEIYAAMLQEEPDNEQWKKRLAELKPQEAMPAAEHDEIGDESGTDLPEAVLESLSGWLANIGRVRECRSKSA